MRGLETFSYLPAFSEDEVAAQIRHILDRGLVVGIEHADRVDPYEVYWTFWRLPLFGERDPGVVLGSLADCRRAHPNSYVRVNGYDAERQGQVVSFVVHRPEGA